MAVTPNMGLVKWADLKDPYDHTQLAGNFDAIDKHDHTTGKGLQIPTAGIKDLAITTPKLADASVTTIKLADGSITSVKIATGVVASLGDMKLWWRPNGLTAVPTGGWVIASGQSLIAADHDFSGGGTIILPNLIERFPTGAVVENIGVTGGSNTINLQHSHNVNAHAHSINPHSHTLNLESGFNASTNLKVSQDLAGSAWVHSDDNNGAQHRHSINGSVDATGQSTNAAASTTDGKLGSAIDHRPAWIGLLPLLKVKNS